MGWFVTNPYMRAQLEGNGRGMSLAAALYMAPLMLGIAFVLSIFGGMLSAWIMEFYETKIKGGKHLYAWVMLALVVAVLFVWVSMNVEVSYGSSFVE
jgi:hypothetical protein